MESKGDFIIWIILFFALFIIIGLYMSEDTPLKIKMKDKILGMNNTIENFTSNSTSFPSGSINTIFCKNALAGIVSLSS